MKSRRKRSQMKTKRKLSPKKEKKMINNKSKVALTILLDGTKGRIYFNNIQLQHHNDGTSCKTDTNILTIVDQIKKLDLYKEITRKGKMNWSEIKKVFKSDTVNYLNDMKKLIDLRQKLVNELKNNFCKDCTFTTSGSGSLTSDIDVTVSKKTDDYFGVKEIQEMNEIMKCLFDDVESLISLDVNFYGHSFVFPINVGKFCIKMNDNEFYPMFDDQLENKYKYQEALAILKIKKHDTGFFNYPKCETIIQSFNKISLSKDDFDLFKYVDKSVDLTEQNKLYFKQLSEIENFTTKIEKEKEIDYNRYRLISEISKASMFADETYYTYGAFMHIVYFTQMKRNIILHPLIYLHSMLENFGDTLKVFHHTEKGNQVEFIKNASKYMMRVYDAILKTSRLVDSENVRMCKLFLCFYNIREQVKSEKSDECIIKNEIKKIEEVIKEEETLIDAIKNDVMFVYKTKFNGDLFVSK